ncbi:short-chain dehydrogenase/reductase [Sphingobium lactosutens]|uniref:SDR family oxidoreductase n=1 Tax=Sphingobium lactosutens TaxID=522773 RepID=UPI0015BCC70E|nr:SDR family oxidoreductase [Sphingobium lactosutens]NWK95953.1 short-chain dehydrogenase/reductase [Sphingobium lactosutens]
MAERKTWFITGTSRGFGRVWTKAALKRGDRVIATARNIDSLEILRTSYGNDVLLPLTLDVTDRDAVFAAVTQGHEHFGRIDVIINNAGYGLSGAIEEVSAADARAQLETNVLGALWGTQAVLPIMRRQGSGHILSVSSIGGVVAFPTLGLYHASKWALEAMMDSLSQEVGNLGIKVTLIEPGGYATDFGDPSSMKFSTQIAAYDEPRARLYASFEPDTIGDPQATGDAILKVIDADQPPLRIFLGAVPLQLARATYEARLATWDAWAGTSIQSQRTISVPK